ncbi:hypothetical protein BGY98DRAFT_255307 [Russula aff. rugulosa BPL654]|nr:hypothetical protein BGY98DRAFT_255307 [Russula aff. rugulosa BPL654]
MPAIYNTQTLKSWLAQFTYQRFSSLWLSNLMVTPYPDGARHTGSAPYECGSRQDGPATIPSNLRHTPRPLKSTHFLFFSHPVHSLILIDAGMFLASQRTSMETFLTPDQNRRDSRRLQAAD